MLLHPLPLGALALLILNDHWLKFAGVLPGSLTGKLSDFAGLVVAPLVLVELCQLVRAPGSLHRQTAFACAFVGSLFVLVKTVPAVNAAYVAASQLLLSPLGWRAAAVVDPTDLIALVALAAPLFTVRHVERGPAPLASQS